MLRRENSPYETAKFALRGIKEESDYLFSNADGGEFKISGKQLSKDGICITIPKKRSAKIYFYKEI